MKLPYYVVDAFTTKAFTGNPAGVCPLEAWLPDPLLQAIAAENNLSETAFFVKEGNDYRLRWFAPAAEVDLCGHATLGAAHVLYHVLGRKDSSVRFLTKSGPLTVDWEGSRLILSMTAIPLSPQEPPPALLEGLAVVKPRAVFRSMDWVCVLNDEESVRGLSPRLDAFKKLDLRGVVVTAPGKDCDYVLRCFAPKVGIPEDPVTGSAQAMLAPFWAARLSKHDMTARQLSARTGELHCQASADRVRVGGRTSLYLTGEINC